MRTADQLHEYQQRAVNFQCTHPYTALWLDPGLGKTAVTLTSIAYLLACKHLNAVVIVAPIRVCRLVWRQEAMKWQHTSGLTFSMLMGTKDQRTRALLRPANVYLINYENLGWLAETLHTYFISKKKDIPFDGLVWDECFVKGTQVQTENSHIAIDKLKIGDIVMTHLGPRRVLNTMKKKTKSLVEIRLNNGQVLKCTHNHPVKVGDAWVPAGQLKKGDLLHEISQHSTVRSGQLSNLQSRILEKARGTIHLLKGVREQVENATARNKEGRHWWWNKGTPEASRTIRGVEYRQTLVAGDAIENERVSQETGPLSPHWWQRFGRVVGGKSIENRTTSKIRSGVHFSWSEEVRGLLNSLQNRLCRRREQNRNRSAGAVAQHLSRKTEGREEAKTSRGTWVDSVVHHELSDSCDVWNIHVEEAETYIVGGVLVHNCSKMKNSTTQRVKSVRKILPYFKWRTGLTGTPATNGYQDLHGQYLVLDEGVRLGTSKTAFKSRFYRKVGPYKEVPLDGTETVIKQLIGDMTIEMSAEDYLKMPDLIVNNIEVELPDELRATYDRMEKEFFIRLDSGTEIEMFNQASLTNKLLQFSNGAMYPVAGMPLWEPIHDMKLDALEDIIEESAGQPILCSYAYRSDAERIMKRFADLDPINLTECKTESSLNNAMHRWRTGNCRLMIGHPASMGHGVDGLQERGHTLVWFGLNWSLDLVLQFNARIRRQGQGVPVICHRILCKDTLDQAQALALDEKAQTQTALRKAIKEYRQTRKL